MLFDRGYNVDEIEEWPSANEVEKSADYQKISILVGHLKKKRSILVLWSSEVRVGIHSVREIEDCMKREQVNDAIVVVRESITRKAQQAILELTRARTADETKQQQVKKKIQVFTQEELVFNITTHQDVPPHRLLSRAEVEQLLNRYKCALEDLPELLVTDPIAKYYGWKRGNVCEILGKSETAIRVRRYRVVM